MGMDLKILCVGDVVGNPGLDRVRRSLRYLKRKTNADFVIVNGENAAVVGITPDQAEDIFDAGADVITLGNHSFNRREIVPYLDENSRILRPANYAPQTPGRGWGIYETKAGPIAIIDLIGRCNMEDPLPGGCQNQAGGDPRGGHLRKTGYGLYARRQSIRRLGYPYPCAHRRCPGIARRHRLCYRSGYDRPQAQCAGHSP